MAQYTRNFEADRSKMVEMTERAVAHLLQFRTSHCDRQSPR